ncbi:hypothetical protein KP509_27G022800 [Ceratopteris richardii]|uniref:Methyltransferase type 11 domain-containing protein n=2 Tax=Ceratopteris richardii TaxID=49495 RepID=A0A8T2RGM8_CERRI|nr:hypothetical protein KP509_27G022800 [Ceratopteris richardii]KAH7294877.1 hypothetical protein KP509_27G022800 [Ceratopteris richardii]KAH7294878.1 hypothetical protein KP509_27G022800 [Ceratopteris richardii]KAH7294880.1 hypothetical protein KP509_27G022800 [Ceratopteris richardii]
MMTDETNSHLTPDIEKKYVHGVYDAIASHFSSTRFAKWPKVANFLETLVPGSLIIDAGCGNGKYLGLNPRCFFMGCDLSAPLISICSQRGHEVLVADALCLPYRTESFDAAISIAVLHHLSTEERRKKAVEELARVVVKGGSILITVWAVEQEDKNLISRWTPLTSKYSEEWVGAGLKSRSSKSSGPALESIEEQEVIDDVSNNHDELKLAENAGIQPISNLLHGKPAEFGVGQQDYFVPWHLPYHRAEIAGATAGAIASGLARKDDKKGAIIYDRYYHVFAEGELERLVSGVRGVDVFDSFYDKSNWCVILRKT